MSKLFETKIAIIGSGVVGQATGKGLAKLGYDIIFYDKNTRTINDLKKHGYTADHVKNITEHNLSGIDFFLVSVPTPTANGRVQLDFLEQALTTLGRAIKNNNNFPIVVIRSTVPPGTTENLAAKILEEVSGKKNERDFGICMNPEFLREASSERDFVNPWMIVIGADDKKSANRLAKIYSSFKCPIVFMSLKEAEMMKYAHNLLNATKISFFNEMRIVGNEIGVDPEVIFPIVVKSAEAMWNPEYGIKNFGPYDGVCLPKDTEAFFTWALDEIKLEMPVLKGTIETNRLVQKMEIKNQADRKLYLNSYHVIPVLNNKNNHTKSLKKVIRK